MALVTCLNDMEMIASSCSANQPDDNRTVVMYDYVYPETMSTPVCCAAQYIQGSWYVAVSGLRLAPSPYAIWSEMLLGDCSQGVHDGPSHLDTESSGSLDRGLLPQS